MIEKPDIEQARNAAETPVLIETDEALQMCASQWDSVDVLGIDTEFLRERTYRADLGLVQVSDGHTAWLIDPLGISDLTPLAHMLQSPSVLKCFHSASEDLEVLWVTLNVSPSPMIDSQVACAMVGQPLQISYHAVISWLCEVELDKEQTRSNWLKRPLTEKQLHYAANDVVFLPLICRELIQRLETLGRSAWVEQDIDLMRRSSRTPPMPEHAWKRVKGAGRLNPQQLMVLRELARWREETAVARNRARGFVIPDAVMLQMARQRPENGTDLADIEGLHPTVIKRYGQTLLSLIENAAGTGNPPQPIPPLEKAQRQTLDALRTRVKQKGQELGVDPALLASRKVLEDLIRSQESGGELPERLRGWREEVITRELLETLGQLHPSR
ncbi:ribonuclease D [Elongatibacter sediminis]|uniref:Ribonuclease D n=1 Tax=Elongatibacter sediminis TaxID=3119006 RepID=A0AAW9RA53_9GAMM